MNNNHDNLLFFTFNNTLKIFINSQISNLRYETNNCNNIPPIYN